MTTLPKTVTLSDILSLPTGKKGRKVDPDRRRATMQALAMMQLFGDRKPNPIALAFIAGGVYHSLIGNDAQITTNQLTYVTNGIQNVKDERGNPTNEPGHLAAEFGQIKSAIRAELIELARKCEQSTDPIEFLKSADLPAYLTPYKAENERMDKATTVYRFYNFKPLAKTTEWAEELANNLADFLTRNPQ